MSNVFDSHLSNLSPRNSNTRYSAGRQSVSTTSSHRSIQNVTDSLDINRLSNEITDTENTIMALQHQIRAAELRQTNLQQKPYVNTYEEFDEAEKDFEVRHSRPRTYRPLFTLSFLVICFIMFLVELGVNNGQIEDLSQNPLIGPSVQTLLKLGAKDTDLLQSGEVWRLFAPMILHVGVIHLVINMLGLIFIGIPMEQEFGSLKIGTIALSSGLMGTTISALFAPALTSVGASGAIFGLYGAAWADLIQNWHTYRGKNGQMLSQLLVCTGVNFVLGLMPFVDNFAHIGGFGTGLVIGMALLVKTYGDPHPNKTLQVFLRVTSAIVLPIIAIGLLFLLFLGFDLADGCENCSYLSCVPFPPRVSDEDKWWSCSPCSNGHGSFSDFRQAFGVTITCPNGTDIFVGLSDRDLDKEEFQRDFIAYCELVCDS